MNKSWLKDKISQGFVGVEFEILAPPNPDLGDYSTNLAFVLAKKENKNPISVGEELVAKFRRDKEFAEYFDKIEFVRPGFVNFYLSREFLRKKLGEMFNDENFGFNNFFGGKRIVVEYTDPNPFKLFHIGHLVPNVIGESIARLYEFCGAKVVRVNYQGDVGLHVAKAVWGMMNKWQAANNMEQIGQAYAMGSKAYEEDERAKKEIEDINQKIYERSDSEINRTYDLGKKLSLEYFETIYKKLGTKFDYYFFESETAQDGLKIINDNKKVFTESDGALIFKGEDYGLHNRVFVSSKGLPTYEAKEMGLNKKKFEIFAPDLSIIVTGNEINDYFRVLLKVMELTMPEVAEKTKHLGHGMLRLASGKMSSRTGNVISAESLIEQTISHLPDTNPEVKGVIAIGAIKYSILKQNVGSDILFNFDKALSVKGDAAPYLQYTYARLKSILRKSGQDINSLDIVGLSKLELEEELLIVRHLSKFPEMVKESAESYAINNLALYLYALATLVNHYYEKIRILDDETEKSLRDVRLLLVANIAKVLKKGLALLGIEVLERI